MFARADVSTGVVDGICHVEGADALAHLALPHVKFDVMVSLAEEVAALLAVHLLRVLLRGWDAPGRKREREELKLERDAL